MTRTTKEGHALDSGLQNRVDEVSLLRRVASGDEVAVKSLLDGYLPRVLGFVTLRLGGNASAAEDVVHETIIDAVKGAHTFRGDSALSTWLCTIARRKVATHFEKERRRDDAMQAMIANEIDAHNAIDTRDQVIRGLGALPPIYRQVLVMKYLDDMSAQDIATALGKTVVQVNSALQRARAAFKSQVGPLL
ncbi:MAG: RNA polymerase sigma factor [Actinomycetota bacterium]